MRRTIGGYIRHPNFAGVLVIGLGCEANQMGALFVAAPGPAAALFGIQAPENAGRAYIPAIGFRDLALGLYLIGLLIWSGRPALRVVLFELGAGRPQRLFLTVRGVERHINALFAKLGLSEDQDAHHRVRAVLLYLSEH